MMMDFIEENDNKSGIEWENGKSKFEKYNKPGEGIIW